MIFDDFLRYNNLTLEFRYILYWNGIIIWNRIKKKCNLYKIDHKKYIGKNKQKYYYVLGALYWIFYLKSFDIHSSSTFPKIHNKTPVKIYDCVMCYDTNDNS